MPGKAAAPAQAKENGAAAAEAQTEAEKRAAADLHEISVAMTKATASGSGTSIGEMALDVLLEVVDDQIYAVIFECHRAYKLKLRSPISAIMPSTKIEGLVDVPGYDIFGNKPDKCPVEAFRCPHCNTLRQPAKFAPHLEKCMGMGGRELRRVRANKDTTTSAEPTATPPKRKAVAQPDGAGQSQKVVKISNGPTTPIIVTTEDVFT
eukprot:m.103247 g.103247  ORF g.103247 m.103247 type:complete len:207 (-) comp20865_c1_seq4:1499-2119(-)